MKVCGGWLPRDLRVGKETRDTGNIFAAEEYLKRCGEELVRPSISWHAQKLSHPGEKFNLVTGHAPQGYPAIKRRLFPRHSRSSYLFDGYLDTLGQSKTLPDDAVGTSNIGPPSIQVTHDVGSKKCINQGVYQIPKSLANILSHAIKNVVDAD